jgi:lipopolysaccharide/colanic/teichoic acid biosynthesis glycosyltransferase
MKRCFDLLFAGLALLVLLPVLGLVYLGVLLTLGRPVLFRQRRAGLHGRPFTLVKFRTMTPGDPALGTLGNTTTDGIRLTAFGRFLRAASMDELPTLWNVVRGEMSLVGPRPLLLEYLPRYSLEQARRHQVRPGITGLAQVHGRNALTWEDRLSYDVSYVDSRSFLLDLRILILTVRSVLRRTGITTDGSPTSLVFTGSNRLAADE